MFFKTFTLAFSLATAVTASFVKRDETTKLYAYGKGISGFEVYAGQDGKHKSFNTDGFVHNSMHSRDWTNN